MPGLSTSHEDEYSLQTAALEQLSGRGAVFKRITRGALKIQPKRKHPLLSRAAGLEGAVTRQSGDCTRPFGVLTFVPMKKGILLLLFGFSGALVHAQGTGEIYAAPGMAVRLPGRVQLVTAHPKKLLTAKETVIPAIFSRFWQQPDSAKRSALQLFLRHLNGNTKYPVTTLRAQLEGIIFIRLIILPTGEVSKVEIVGRELNEQFANIENKELMSQAKADLDAAALKSVQGIRFAPGSATDSITVPRKFVMQ